MNASLLNRTVILLVVVLTGLSRAVTLFAADACPVPSFAAADASGVSVVLGNGEGAFGNAVHFNTGANPQAIATGDFNGDGKMDLAVANAGSANVALLLNRGEATFAPAIQYSVGTSPRALATSDFNGDAKLDLVVANSDSSNLSVLLGRGDGTLQPAVNY